MIIKARQHVEDSSKCISVVFEGKAMYGFNCRMKAVRPHIICEIKKGAKGARIGWCACEFENRLTSFRLITK